MKGRDCCYFWIVFFISSVSGFWVFDDQYDSDSDLITFLSIIVGFEITSLSILFNSTLKKTLYNREIKKYKTELHRLRDFYQFSLNVNVISIILIFIVPKFEFDICICNNTLNIGKHLLVMPILMCTIYCFVRLNRELFKIFVHPTNE